MARREEQNAGADSAQEQEAHWREWQRRVGRRIHLVRKRACPNAQEFARRLRVDSSTIKKIESGDRQPSARLLYELSNKLNVTADYILRGEWRTLDPAVLDLLDDAMNEIRSLRERPDMEPYRPRKGLTDDTPEHPKMAERVRN